MNSNVEKFNDGLEELLFDRPIASIHEAAYFYGLLNTRGKFESINVPSDYSFEYVQYMTPNKLDEYVDDDNGLLVLDLDMSRDQIEVGGAEIKQLNSKLKPKLGYVGRAGGDKGQYRRDFSVTESLNGESDSLSEDSTGYGSIVFFIDNWLNRWVADEMSAESVEVTRPWVLSDLSRFVASDSGRRQIASAIESAVEQVDSFDGIFTIRIKFEDDYLYPGEVPELMEAAIAKKSERLTVLNTDTADDSSGEGVGFISGETGEVFGATAEPFELASYKQELDFPLLDANENWTIRPFSRQTAHYISEAEPILDELRLTVGGEYSLYIVPIPSASLSVDTFNEFYREQYSGLIDEDGKSEGVVSWIIDKYTDDSESLEGVDNAFMPNTGSVSDDIRFIYVMKDATDNSPKLYKEVVGAPIVHLLEFSNTYSSFGSGLSEKYPIHKLQGVVDIGSPPTVLSALLNGSLFTSVMETVSDSKSSSDKATISADVRKILGELLETGEVDSQWLLRLYTNHLINRQNDLLGSDGSIIPSEIIEQYIQLAALDDAGVIDEPVIGSKSLGGSSVNTVSMPDKEQRFEEFIGSHPVLDGDAAQAVFSLGCLVGSMSKYQQTERDLSRTLAQKHPIGSFSRQTSISVCKSVLEKYNEYEEAYRDFGRRMNNAATSQLPDKMLSQDPSEWSLSNEKAKWIYALGIAYGKEDYFESNSDTAEAEAEQTGDTQ